MLATKNGKAIRFLEEEVRPMGRAAKGVKGISLDADDEVIGMQKLFVRTLICLLLQPTAFGKRTSLSEYRLQGRGGKGIINIKTSERNGPVVAVEVIKDNEEVMIISAEGIIIRLKAEDISNIGRFYPGRDTGCGLTLEIVS